MTACELSIWGDIANIVIAVASVATAIVTAVVLIKQRNDSINEKQPRFYFPMMNNTLYIRTDRERLLRLVDVGVTHYLEIYKPDGLFKTIIPIKCSNGVSIKTDSLGPFATVTIDAVSNTRLNKKITDYLSKHNWNYAYNTLELICISYVDVYRHKQKQYFVNRVMTSNFNFTQYEMWSSTVSSTPIAVADIDFDAIIGNKNN